MEKKIVLKFDKRTGKVAIEAMGFTGSSCEQATKFLRGTLGEMEDFQQKAEWFETNLELNGKINSDLCG